MSDTITLMFRDLLKRILEMKKLSQHELAFHANVSQTTISLLGSHKRNLTPQLASDFARILGGDTEFWLDAHKDFKEGQPKELESYLNAIGGGYADGQEVGVGTRRLLNNDILDLFWTKTGAREDEDGECCILGFDPRRVRPSAYYTRLGYVDGAAQPLRSDLTLKPGEALQVRTLESFHFPLWLEAEIHPASTLALRGLSVDHGPTIDPGFDKGALRVLLRNIGAEEAIISPEDNFLKLRFTVFDRAALSHSRLLKDYDLTLATDEAIYKHATLEVT